MKIVELTMIKFRRMIGSLKEQIKDGSVIVRIVEGKAGPPPKNKSDWARDTEVIGYIISPQAFRESGLEFAGVFLEAIAKDVETPEGLKERIKDGLQTSDSSS